MRNRDNNVEKIGRCPQPVFIANGTADGLVPFALGQRLFNAANEPKQFYPLEGADHNDPIPREVLVSFRRFLEQAEASSSEKTSGR
jgi:fermentation-respiration switch protein FrsA (DUF1100 family)